MPLPLPRPFEDDLLARIARFIREVVIPCEKDPRNHGHGPSEDLVRELRRNAREAGLIAPQLPAAWGGQGLTHVQTAAVFRMLPTGRSGAGRMTGTGDAFNFVLCG